jgi:hypothetical protein
VCKRCYHKEIWPERPAARRERRAEKELSDQALFGDGDEIFFADLDGLDCELLDEDDDEFIDDEAMMRAWGNARRDWEWTREWTPPRDR